MDPATALSRITMLTNATADPVLTSDELNYLVTISSLEDSNLKPPSDVAWIPTYELNIGIARGWRMKAGKVANRMSFNADRQSFQVKELFDNFNKMAEDYEKKIVLPIRPQTTLARRYPCPSFLNNGICSCGYCSSYYGLGGATGWLI